MKLSEQIKAAAELLREQGVDSTIDTERTTQEAYDRAVKAERSGEVIGEGAVPRGIDEPPVTVDIWHDNWVTDVGTIQMESDTPSEVVASTYLWRNRVVRSVIIFRFVESDDFYSHSTVVMPEGGNHPPEQVTRLVDAVRNVVNFNCIDIEDLHTKYGSPSVVRRPRRPTSVADMGDEIPF